MRRLVLLLLFIATNTSQVFSADDAKDEPVIDVVGTLADHDYFKAFGMKLYLPRILFWSDASGASQFGVYASTKSAIKSGDFVDQDHALVPADGGVVTFDMSITSHLIYFWFGMGSVVLLTIVASRRYRKGVGVYVAPKGPWQNIFEILFVFIRDEVARANIDKHKADRYVPYLFTVFMGIASMNLFGLLPWAATATADLTVTGTLALFTFFITQFSGTKDYWGHIFWFPGVPTGVKFLMIFVEVIGLFTKPFALAIRLFANMLSGKIMIIVVLGLIFIFAEAFGAVAGYGVSVISVALTATLYALKAFVALLQAYIFSLLSAVFIGMAAESHHHEGDEDHAMELSH
ncbi:MAG: F0F1 ATP synthase subunit A [Bacteroidota bacterium]